MAIAKATLNSPKIVQVFELLGAMARSAINPQAGSPLPKTNSPNIFLVVGTDPKCMNQLFQKTDGYALWQADGMCTSGGLPCPGRQSDFGLAMEIKWELFRMTWELFRMTWELFRMTWGSKSISAMFPSAEGEQLGT